MNISGCNFSFFKLIYQQHGSLIMKVARNLERTSINIAKYKEHLTFNYALKRSRILSKGLRFNPPVRCQEGFRIVERTGWKFLRLRIQHSHQRIDQLTKERDDYLHQLFDVLTTEYFSHLRNVIQHNVRRSSEKMKSRHLNKLTNLGATKKVLNFFKVLSLRLPLYQYVVF